MLQYFANLLLAKITDLLFISFGLITMTLSSPPALIQADLYFDQVGSELNVTDSEFRQFLKAEVTSRFPDGLTVYNTSSQSNQPSNAVSLVFTNTLENSCAIDAVIQAYQQKFRAPARRVVNQDLAIGFGQGEDLIQNDPTPELIQVDLYFGRNIGTTGRVTEQEFQQFLGTEITPRFPDGLTAYNAKGQFLDSAGQLIREPSKVVSLIFEDTEQNEQSVYEIIDAYEQQFQQESVLEVVNEAVTVGFGQGEDVIDNDWVPEPIQVDLYFGRNVGNTGRVTEQQFQQFLSDQIMPYFSDDLTVYDAKGQFLDSSDRLIREPSKVVSLTIKDTEQNEQSINAIISAYRQQFQQESVLQVVDETLAVDFGITLSTSPALYSLFATGR